MSDKPVTERLQVKNGRTLAVVNAPRYLEAVFAASPHAGVDQSDVVLLFVAGRAPFVTTLTTHLPKLKPMAILWVAYPKLSSKLAADLSRDVIHAMAPTYGLDTVSAIAIDDDWSALRLKRV